MVLMSSGVLCRSIARLIGLYIKNIRTGPGPVLSLFGLKDHRTGPFKKAKTVDTLLEEAHVDQ